MGKRKQYTGTVVSDKMMKTVIVKIMHLSKHPKYGKIMKRFNKFKAHDELNTAKLGDTVKIEETRPISKDKRFRVLKIVKKSQTPNVELRDEVK